MQHNLVDAVRLDARGEVIMVKLGVYDPDVGAWLGNGPQAVPVGDLVNRFPAEIYARIPGSQRWGKLQRVLAKSGGGLETVGLENPAHSFATMDKF